jgi:hypothetical protein
MRCKGPHVRDLLDGLVGGLASAMAGTRLDAQQVRANTEVGGLERRDVLE